MFQFLRVTACFVALTAFLQATAPDISNLSTCINEVRSANANPPFVPTFAPYTSNYRQLLADLEMAVPHLPYVYQQAAARPLIQFLQNLGEVRFLQIFNSQATDGQTSTLQEIIPDAALSILLYNSNVSQGINAFSEVVSDLYNSFLSNENRVGRQSGRPIEPPTYGVIPPLVKFGNQDFGPYTWPADATRQVLGMGCGIVSLPPSQLYGGVLAWSTLGHETGGHDVTHADQGLLDELAQKVRRAVLRQFRSYALADYWAKCIDEASADAYGYLNVGPSGGIALIGYFRALGNGKLRTVGSMDDPHPIDLLRGYFAAAVIKRLKFRDAALWSQIIFNETQKDNAPLYLIDGNGRYTSFPVSFADAVDSADLVAQIITQTPISKLQYHFFQELEDWRNLDQDIVDQLVPILKSGGALPGHLQGPGFYAAYVIAAATQAALEAGANPSEIFFHMQTLLAAMHRDNPIWSTIPNALATALLERVENNADKKHQVKRTRYEVPETEEAVAG